MNCNMRKHLFTLLLCLTCTVGVQAQDVFLQIREKAQSGVSDPDANVVMKKINKFKVDELDYLSMKMKECMPDSSVTFLDRQAFAMNSFLTLYMTTVLKAHSQPKAFQVKVLQLFMDASYSNPLFNDEDKEVTLSYYSRSDSVTRFSLDTDWRRAIAAAMAELKKEEYQF